MEIFKALPARRHFYLGEDKGSAGGDFRFFSMLSEVFGDLLPPLVPPVPLTLPPCCAHGFTLARALHAGACGAARRSLDWRTSHVVAEVHDPVGVARFRAVLWPRLAVLRRAYAAAGCALEVSTVLREPAPAIEQGRIGLAPAAASIGAHCMH